MQLSERLKKVLDAEDIFALFPLLKDWTTDELQALLKDVDEYADAANKTIDAAWKQVALLPGVFFSEGLSKALDQARDEKRKNLVMVMAEIYSVAFFYLHERGVEPIE